MPGVEGFIYPNELELQWSVLIVLYPFITGLVAGAFIMASLVRVFRVKPLEPVYRLSLLTALAFLLCATLPLLFHLGRDPSEKRNVAAGFSLTLQEDPYLPTDTTPLYPKGVPVLAFFTGGHDDYHRPTDKADTLNYDGTARIARFARGILADLERAARGGQVPVGEYDQLVAAVDDFNTRARRISAAFQSGIGLVPPCGTRSESAAALAALEPSSTVTSASGATT